MHLKSLVIYGASGRGLAYAKTIFHSLDFCCISSLWLRGKICRCQITGRETTTNEGANCIATHSDSTRDSNRRACKLSVDASSECQVHTSCTLFRSRLVWRFLVWLQFIVGGVASEWDLVEFAT